MLACVCCVRKTKASHARCVVRVAFRVCDISWLVREQNPGGGLCARCCWAICCLRIERLRLLSATAVAVQLCDCDCVLRILRKLRACALRELCMYVRKHNDDDDDGGNYGYSMTEHARAKQANYRK